ncbi:MAG: DUF72 domain-containing protein [Burkholderiales bacterium]|nr:DUF72 domain-containing protein [Anaerolineae bacterium]
MGKLHIGTSGFNYKDWREIFYPKGTPQKAWLAYFAQHFNTVEINATFYGHFKPHVFANWRDSTPDDFCFALKGPKIITHTKRLQEVDEDLRYFLEGTTELTDKLGVILWQMPPSYKYDEATIGELEAFLAKLPTDTRQALEVRHKSWFNDEFYALLNRFGVGFVVNDSSRWAQAEAVTGGFMYVRFHGPDKLYASEYSAEEMQAWAEKIKPRLEQMDVFIYFNNDYGGRALRNAVQLRELLE